MNEQSASRHPAARHGIDEAKVRAAIAEAERNTSGKIEVVLAPSYAGEIEHAAQRAFRARFGKSHQRNGILFFVAPDQRKFVVWGDVGTHEKVGQTFWDRIVAAVRERFTSGDLTGGLIHGVREAGEALRGHFPK
ncbi:MAG: TPM domain-containing protein [Candidatus Eremiobacteraeota bacterium]|nr:TPM domain-containing protein [Candidatus Eremiobacteraeota bacterium]